MQAANTYQKSTLTEVNTMATSKEYFSFILEQLSEIDGITLR